ncbi:MAG: amino acid permease [Deltaproteobacteria bacterium]|nr:amino acid permease [Deltaproteobacteria bacterium]
MNDSTKNEKRPTPATRGTLGTFAGVFTPSVLTILGIILFLRLGYVVGNAGLGRSLMVIGLANAISVLTTFSLSAIATNLKVKGGGDYYLISRTLGVEFGGSIGIVLFLAQSISIAFYCIGFGEALSGMVPVQAARLPQWIAALAVAFLFIFAWLGADWATKFQYIVMTILGMALVSFFYGGIPKWDGLLVSQNWTPPAGGLDFWVIFAIFFPAVTGFTQGVSMSGDLRDAGKSLPLGTFFAVGISIVVYFGTAFVFAGVLPGNELMGDYGAMKRVARFGIFIDAGVIAATLSSAMASFLGAPRILQSMARDRIIPLILPFARGSGPGQNPRRGVLLSAGIALATIALGNLNLIAPVVSMFFLISYGLLNYATFYEARTSSPSFRPRFRWFDYRLSLLGWLSCLGVILAINLTAGAIGMAVLFAIHQYLKRTAGPARWADSRRSYHLQRLREHLLAAAAEPEHPRDWRPQLLAFTEESRRREQLLRFSAWLEGGSGLTSAVRVIEGEGIRMLKEKEEAERDLQRDIRTHDLKAFPMVLAAPDLDIGVYELVQAFGIGPLRANTILLNWHDPLPKGLPELKDRRYGRNIKTAFRFGLNVVILNARESDWDALKGIPPKDRRVDVWWWDDTTSRLMLLLAYLMTRTDDWDESKIRVLAAGFKENADRAADRLRKTLEEVRIEAEPEVISKPDTDQMAHHSSDASLVFIPFRIKGAQLVGPSGENLGPVLERLPVTAMVLAAEDIALDAEPEEGKAAEMAAAADALFDAEQKAREAEEAAEKAGTLAEQKLQELEDAIYSGADENVRRMAKETAEARGQAEKASRRAAKATAKVEFAGQEAEAMGVKPDEKDDDKDGEQDWEVFYPRS